MAYEGPEYFYVIYKAIGDFGSLMRDAAEAKAALQGMGDAVKAETAAEVAGSTQAAAARQKDIASIQQETQALSQLASSAKATNTQLLYGGRNDMTQHLSDMAQELNYTTLLNRQKWLGFSSVQQAMSYRQQMYQLALLENKAHFAGYLTADQYLGFLQRETMQTASLSAAIRDRTAAIGSETAMLLAHANALQGTSQTAGSLGEGLSTVGAYNAALTGLPDTVSTKAVLDDSQAMAQVAAYRAALLGLPHAESTDIVSSATRLGGIPLSGPAERVPVTVTPELSSSASAARALAAEMKQLDAVTARPQVDPSSIEKALDDAYHLDGVLVGLTYERAEPEVRLEGAAQAVTEASLLALEMGELDRHARVNLGVSFAEVEAARLDADALEAGLEVLDGEEVHTVIYVDGLTGAVQELEDFTRAWEEVPRAEELQVVLDDAGAEDELGTFVGDLIAAARKKYEFYAGMDDSEVLKDLDVIEGRILSAEEQGKALMSLLGQGGSSGGGGGGGPPPVSGGADAPNPDDAAAWKQIADELAQVDALFENTTRTAKTTAEAVANVGKAAQSMVEPLVASTGGWFGLNSQLRIFGGLLGTVSAWHVVLDFLIEGIAVFVPAIATMIAGMTAFGIAGSDAGVAVYNRIMAIHTASDALNATIPPMTGNLEKLHDQVRPQVWELYGDAIDVVHNKTGLFSQLAIATGNVVDRLAARLTVDLESGSKGLETFFGVGAANLAKLGTFFSNIGQALLAFIKVTQETHVDQIFLSVFVALSQLLVLVTKLPTPLLAAVVGLHAFWLWGGLLATVVMQMLNPLRSLALALGAVNAAEVEGGLASLTENASAFEKLKAGLNDIGTGLGAIPARFGLFSKSAEEATAAAEGTAVATEDVGAAAGATAAEGGGLVAMLGRLAPALASPVGIAGALAVALTGVYVYLGMMPDATQKWINSLNQALAKASVFTVVSQTVGDLAAATTELAKAQSSGVGNVTELAGAQRGLSTDLGNELTHVGQVSKAYGTDFVGALALLNTAGVKTSDLFSAQGTVWAADLQQVKGLVAGYAAMGQGLSALQQDVSVQLVNTSDQVTAMGKLNTAWDTWTATVAGAPSAFISLAQGIAQFNTDAKAAGSSMTGLTAPSLTLQSDFQANYSNVEKFFDAFRSDQALTGTGDFTQFVKDSVATLIPLAGGSKEAAAQISALAQEAGGPATDSIKTLQQWVGSIADPLQKMYDATNNEAIAASSLSQDAQRLTSTLEQDLNPAMANAVFNAHGGQQVFNAFADALAKSGPGSTATAAAAKKVATELLAVSGNSTSAKANFVGFAEAMGLNAQQADKLWAQASAHITANLTQVRKNLASTASTPANLVKPGEVDTMLKSFKDGTFYELTFLAWIPQVQRGLNVMNHDIGQFFTHDIPAAAQVTGHAFEAAWDGMVNWFTQSVPHGFMDAWTPVSQFFDKAFTHDIPEAWNTAWANTISPVTHAFDGVKNFVTSSFDTWWKTHGSAVEAVWNAVWGQIRSDALGAWHFIESDAEGAWHVITAIFTSTAAKAFWNFISSGAVWAWQTAVSTARASWIEIEGLAKAAWDIMAAAAKIAWDVIWQFIGAGAKGAADTVVGIFKAAWALVQAAAKIVWDTIVLIVDEVLDIITGHWQTAWRDLESYGIQVWNALKTAGIQMWNALSTATVQVWTAIWNAIKTAAVQVWNALKTGAQTAWTAVWHSAQTTFVNPMASFFTSQVPKWWDSFVAAASKAWGNVWTGFQKDVLTPIENFFSATLPTAMWNSLKGGIDHVISGLNTVIGWINSVTSVVGVHIGSIPSLAHGGPVHSVTGSVPGTGDEDGTHIVAMGGEYMLRKPARMALQAEYGPDVLDYLNNADTWLSSGSRGNVASQQGSRHGRFAAGGVIGDISSWLGDAVSGVGGAAGAVWDGIVGAAKDVAQFGEQAVFNAMWTAAGAPAEKALEALGTPGDLGASWLQDIHDGLSTWMSAQTAKATASAAASAAAVAGAAVGGSAGSVQALAKAMAAARGWTGALWDDLNAVEMDEAGWNLNATNPTSGAYGIAQFIDGPSEYAQYGGNSGTASGQVTAFLNYVAERYGSPAAALAHEEAYHWYASGGPVTSSTYQADAARLYPDWEAALGPWHTLAALTEPKNVTGANWKTWLAQRAVVQDRVNTASGYIGPLFTNLKTNPQELSAGMWSNADSSVRRWQAAMDVAGWAQSNEKAYYTPIQSNLTKMQADIISAANDWHNVWGTGSGTGTGSTGGTGTDGTGTDGTGTTGTTGTGTTGTTGTGATNPGGIGTPGAGSPGSSGVGTTSIDLSRLIIGGPAAPAVGNFGFGIASGGDVPALSNVAAMFGGGMAAGGLVPNLFVPGMSATLSRQLSAAASGEMPRTMSDAAAGTRVGLHVDQLNINNPLREETKDSIARMSNRAAFLAGRGMV